MFRWVTFIVLVLDLSLLEAKVYDKCELASALRSNGVPEDQIATWVCLAHAESDFDTTAINQQTYDYGIFQISSLYWCQSGDSPGMGCGISCNSLLSDDITEDITCIRLIYQKTEEEGKTPGFKAWTTYDDNCAGDNSQWVAGC